MASRRRKDFFTHIHPPVIRERTLLPASTLGLGVVCVTCLILLAATGLTLLPYYVPHQDVAYDWILHILTTLRYGRLIRNLHFAAANALLIAAFLHLARVFFTGSYQGRYLNWVYGLLLLCLILASNYTGYLMPWDQTAYWAIKVGSSLAGYFPLIGTPIKRFLLGGEEIGHDTLIRSYALHVAVLPALYTLFASLHLWRIRKDGGLAAPEDTDSAKVPSTPVLFRAELTVALFTLSALLAVSLLLDAPLAGRADPLRPPNPARAPWYFVGIQEMVSHSAIIGGVVVPLFIGLFLFLSPLLDRSRETAGRWFARERLAFNLMLILVLSSQIALIVIGQWFRSKNWAFAVPW